jgi:hypothetical protein
MEDLEKSTAEEPQLELKNKFTWKLSDTVQNQMRDKFVQLIPPGDLFKNHKTRKFQIYMEAYSHFSRVRVALHSIFICLLEFDCVLHIVNFAILNISTCKNNFPYCSQPDPRGP